MNENINIVVVGGGTAGIMIVAKIHRFLPKAKVVLISPNKTHIYQPGQIFVACGLYQEKDILKPTKDFIPPNTVWLEDEVELFEPSANTVVTKKFKKKIYYDYLIIATGMICDFKDIEGLSEADIGKNGIASVYFNDIKKGEAKGGMLTFKWMQDIAQTAENTTVKVLCTQPNTPIKCCGAPQKLLYLCNDYLQRKRLDLYKNVNFILCKRDRKFYDICKYNEALKNVALTKYQQIRIEDDHELIKIEPQKKTAYFQKIDLSIIKIKYDFIHVVPPMKAVKAVRNSELVYKDGEFKGWLECDQKTLQHKRYANIFGVGDILGIPKAKTGGSARHQAKVVVENLLHMINNEPLNAKYDGYTVCPLKTEFGKVMLIESNYQGISPTFSFLDPAKPRRLWWYFDLYVLKFLYWKIMLKGWL